ncbi:acyl-CoA thioester hydrolase/BAAT C-terminal domain-containing protein [Flavobacterium sp. NRK F7]|uniref:acyl-CoA thioester hydrolase/BAAT C-terminal domain-containing protein n=1 Tax=Flavobacterium sp. NRK F7 TaxID=2954930 RepID=UPI0020909945|nr:acyl-CoA thioester hydrolase/BAAT C-terminal domain-containing protein [Flavobacterium sp. NRK F7]MCO6164339.1 acetylxylan esterase [Flavobacterium sp. NRK F7]
MKKLLKIAAMLLLLMLGIYIFLEYYRPPLDKNHGKIRCTLYVGKSENQPLIVGFGGSEGGNPWESNYWKPTRDEFLKRGYAFLAVEYFGGKTTASNLDRISLNAIHDAIINAAKHAQIDASKIAIIGGSKGGELVLNLASLYSDIDAVVAIVASNVTFPALTVMNNTSSWTYNDTEVPFILPSYAIIPYLLKGDRLGAFQLMLLEEESVKKAVIPVEKMNASVLLLSATQDEEWPSMKMSELVVKRLRENNYKKYYNHIAISGGHTEPLKHFDIVFDFLDNHFINE